MAEVTRKVFQQPAKGSGYRANVDAIHLAHFAASKKSARAAHSAFDLGAGSGAVGLTLLEAGGARRVVFVELDREAADFCLQNVELRALGDRAEVLCADVLAFAKAHRGKSDLVVCNPPYVAMGAGRPPPEARRARARQGDLAHFVAAARLSLGRGGRAAFVYPAPQLASLMSTLRAAGLEPKRLRLVHARISSSARIALVEAQAAKPGGLIIEPPLVEIQSPDGESPERP